MSEKPKRDAVTSAMRARLLVNRTGKMTPNQWLDMVIYPLMTPLVLLIPLSIIVTPFFLRITLRMWLVVPVLLLVLAYVFMKRAYRYARAPVYFALMTAQRSASPLGLFWRSVTLHDDETGQPMQFDKWLAPRPQLTSGQPYLVYYLKDHTSNVVLSIAPVDHPDADLWQPTKQFTTRRQRRDAPAGDEEKHGA